MEVQVEPEILNLVLSLEKDFAKVLSEALDLWLRKRIITCPITDHFCINNKGSCNECSVIRSKKIIGR